MYNKCQSLIIKKRRDCFLCRLFEKSRAAIEQNFCLCPPMCPPDFQYFLSFKIKFNFLAFMVNSDVSHLDHTGDFSLLALLRSCLKAEL